MKTILFFITLEVLTLCALVYYKEEATNNKEQSLLYLHNSEVLFSKLERINHEKKILIKQNKELKAAAEMDKPTFDWYFDISNTFVIKRLQEN